MNAAHWHLVLNHFPIVGFIISTALLIAGIAMKQNNIKAIAALLTLIFSILSIVVFKTGEPAEKIVENLPGVAETSIELHEEAAELAIWAVVVTGITAFASLAFYFLQKIQVKSAFILTALFGLLSVAALVRTGYYGGQIRHTELAGNSLTPADGIPAESGGKSEDDY